MERNIYDDDTVQAGIKYSDILEKSNVTIFGFENGGRWHTCNVCKFLPEYVPSRSPLLELQTLYYEKH